MLLDLLPLEQAAVAPPNRWGEMSPGLNRQYLDRVLKKRQQQEDLFLLLLEEV